MSESAALIKFVSVVDCATQQILYTYADPKLKKAFKDEYQRECQVQVVQGLTKQTLYDGFTDMYEGLNGTWHSYVYQNVAYSCMCALETENLLTLTFLCSDVRD